MANVGGDRADLSERRSEQAASVAQLAPDADAATVEGHLDPFFGTFRDLPGPGPRP